MRSAKEIDYWSKVYQRKYTNNFVSINLNGLNNIEEIDFSEGIMVLCGLNGAGKSTIIAAIKDLIGINLSSVDQLKVNGIEVDGRFRFDEEIIECSNRNENRVKDKGLKIEKVRYIDYGEVIAAQEFNVRQTNFQDLLDQTEEYELDNKEIEELNYLVGKKYSFCGVREFEEIEDLGTVPYFQVKVDGQMYDSRNMGNGEHFLIYLFWCIHNAEKDTILIIEEPETFISITSQIHFTNYLGKEIAEKGVKVILTTHSPYIIKNIKNEHIRMVNRIGNLTSIYTPSIDMTAESILGIQTNYDGTIFVEDKVALDYLIILLEDKAPSILKSYTVDIAQGGETAISQRLSFPKSEKIKYNFVGVYDGDMRECLASKDLNWQWCFLPGDKSLEDIYRDEMHKAENIEKICKYLGKEKDVVMAILSTIDGLDCHDWFEEFRKALCVDGKTLVKAFYNMSKDNGANVDSFIEELLHCLEC